MRDRVAHRAVNSSQGQNNGEHSEGSQQPKIEAARRDRVRDKVFEGTYVENDTARIQRLEYSLDRECQRSRIVLTANQKIHDWKS